MKGDALSRRKFLRQGGVVSLGFLGLNSFLSTSLVSCSSDNKLDKIALSNKYGSLQKDPAGILNLPSGFSYKVISRQGDQMSDGFFSPGRPDGMATFPTDDGKVIIVRNHELLPDDEGPYGKDDTLLSQLDPGSVYDMGRPGKRCVGGTTTLVYNEATGEVETSYLSLAGTLRNCAGGPTPWGSWITCEEIFLNAERGLEQHHGYNFEVPATSNIALAAPIALKEMGKFNHEAVAVDPKTSIVYQTEDQGDGLIYRFIPNTPGKLQDGGRLQALGIRGQEKMDTRNWKKKSFPTQVRMLVEWIDLEDVDSKQDDLRYRGHKAGAARFARGEGMWFGDGELYFACTNGGATKSGQIFRYIPSPDEGTAGELDNPGQLELFAEPNDRSILKYCDNLTIAPTGDLILCEDHEHPFVVGITPDGKYYKLAENVGHASEFAGGVFSPSGKTYFVNIQHAGLTLAIRGPWA